MGLDFWQETDFLECLSSAEHCSQLCLRTRTFDIVSDQSFCDNSLGNQGDDVLGPGIFWDGRAAIAKMRKGSKEKSPIPPLLWVLMVGTIKEVRQPMEGGKVGKDQSTPTVFRIIPMYWAFSGRTGTLQCFVWIHSSISVFPKLFNCWRAMRQEISEFNVKNQFHFSPPTIERFILFLVNDTLHYRALYDLLCAAERTPRFLQIPTIPSFFLLTCLSWSGIQRPLFEITSPTLSGSSWGLQAFYNFGALSQKCALKKKHWKELLVWGFLHGEGVVAHIVDLMENKRWHVGHNLCCIVSTFHSLRSSLLFFSVSKPP